MRRTLARCSRVLAGLLLVSLLPSGSSGATQRRVDYPAEGFILSDADLRKPAEDTLPREQALYDFSVFEYLIRNAYAGYDFQLKRGANWEALFSASRREIASKSEWGAPSYFALLMETLEKAHLTDNHFSLTANSSNARLTGWPGLRSSSARFADAFVRKDANGYWLVTRDSSSTTAQALTQIEGRSPEGFLFPTYAPDMPGSIHLIGSFGYSPSESLRYSIKGKGEAILTLHPAKMGGWNSSSPPVEFRKVDGIPVVSLRTLQMTQASALESFVRTADELREEAVIVLDMRGCAGGNDSYGVRWLQALSSGTFRTPLQKRRIISKLALAGEINRWRSRLAEAPDETSRRQIDSNLRDALSRFAGSTSSSTTWETTGLTVDGTAETGFKGILVILSDRRNASACESFARMAKALPGAVLIGENSYGVNTFGPINCYRLPRSGATLWFGEAMNQFDGTAYEGSGIPPDIWVDETDAMPTVLRYAKEAVRRNARH